MNLEGHIFLSTYSSKVDDKKRASVPSSFRSVVEAKGGNMIYAYASFVNQCLEVCTAERIRYLEQYIDGLDIFSEERDVIATAVLGGCEPLQIDAKGRVSLSETLLKFAEIDKELIFVGKGKVFEIWNKDKFNIYYQHAREAAKQKTALLKTSKN